MDRRRFFASALGGAAALAAVRCSHTGPATTRDPRVTLVRDPAAVSAGQADPGRTGALLERLIREHFNSADPVAVFRSLFSPRDRVGIKINGLSGRRLSTHVELARAVADLLVQAGVPAQNILIWDRMNADLRSAGYTLRPWGEAVACAGCDALGYGGDLVVHRSIGSLFSRAVTDLCTAQINLPVLKDHGIVGVTLGMKNFFGAIHNPNKYHPDRGDPYVADLYSHPDIGGKVRLTIVDALEIQPEGGPPYQPRWCRDFGGLMASTDPVALDRLGWKLIEEQRFAEGLPTLAEAGREPTYIRTAAALGLGENDMSRIVFHEA
ncbi:MAG: DUF362 domain-containing protein [Candidatus Zixiibacteriota bacterium]|nr:MAG: DUF362 domain-containing protein [candidate division Zixibacteria bacterium]